MKDYLFTSESVTEGHPDKVADMVSDAILDAIYSQDTNARVACETLVKGRHVTIAGEISSAYIPNVKEIVRSTIREIGYTDDSLDFSADNCDIRLQLQSQSPDIAMGVDRALEEKEGREEEQLGAGDQGMMFGYACKETKELMPLPISLAHKLCKRLSEVRKSGEIPYLRPDGKSQVTVEYIDHKPVRVDAVVISAQHDPGVDMERLRKDILNKLIIKTIPASMLDDNTKYYINPTGRFAIGGPEGDSGLTGRKIIVDTYGGAAPHGGGCFSGKDPTKVDRSAAYMARYVAKNVVAAGLADRCEVQVAYAIGVANPVSVSVDTNRDDETEDRIERAIREVFDMRPSAIIEKLDLRRPIYKQTASYGHMGREDLDLSWERVDKVDELKKAFEKAGR